MKKNNDSILIKIREIIIEYAHIKKSLTYTKLDNQSGLGLNFMNRSDGIEIGNLLTEISKREFRKGRPILTIIVNKIDRMPSSGFNRLLKVILKTDSSMIQERKFIKLLQKKCFDFWASDENYNKFKNDY